MYRVQRRHGLRTQRPATARTHVTRALTMHQATGPNQVWSWGITWLPTDLVSTGTQNSPSAVAATPRHHGGAAGVL